MCLGRRPLSRRSRIFLALGNLCLFTGITGPRFALHESNSAHFIAGFCIGLSITFLVAAARGFNCPPTRDQS